MFSFVLLYILCVHSSFAINVKEEKASCFAIIVLQKYCFYTCSVALPRGAVT